MSKEIKNELIGLLFLFGFIACFNGFQYALDVFNNMLKLINSLLISLNENSVLTIVFKHPITYSIVGICLTAIGLPKGKEGHIIGKVLYFIIGYIIGIVFDYISTLIF